MKATTVIGPLFSNLDLIGESVEEENRGATGDP
jgi:hypothetical protein